MTTWLTMERLAMALEAITHLDRRSSPAWSTTPPTKKDDRLLELKNLDPDVSIRDHLNDDSKEPVVRKTFSMLRPIKMTPWFQLGHDARYFKRNLGSYRRNWTASSPELNL